MCHGIPDVVNLALVEQVCRRLRMIERAVKRNPRAPDFNGVETILANGYDVAGGVATLNFDKNIAETQMNDAVILKKLKMLREELLTDVNTKIEKVP